ncbi:MAG: cytochrome c [Rubrivivax sp.]|jgi:cytochrome c556|nr:cytochrome c [Rubrivivax sp.]
MKRPLLVVAAIAGLSFALPAAAQFQKPEDAIKYRKAAFTVMAAHFSRIGAMAQGRVPFDGAAATANAEIVATMSALPFTAFGDGTDKGDTRALPKIWSDRANFDAGAKKMQDEVAKLVAAAKSNNLDNVKTAFGAVGQTCKGCHDNFRKE